MPAQIDAILGHHMLPKEDFIYGYSDLNGLIDHEFGEYKFAIVIGKRLNPRIVESIKDGPTMEYYAHYRGMNTGLASLTEAICADLNQIGVGTRRIEPSVTTGQLDTIYEKTLRTSFSHKMAATRAGLGWIGKTDLFISMAFGPRLRLVTILINKPLKTKFKPIDRSRCGSCILCVEVCPAHAANGKLWDVSVDRDEFFDAFKCRKQCAEYGRTRLQLDARVCGTCIAVCPVGHRIS
ncbi:MAG: 4Fe-4S double cluster binding domain-containing protein [Bacteroidales bacterium]|jgi:epoxyqueuosine reductase QueG